MNVLIIDMTHGGAIIASEFSKLNKFNVFALDIYNTLHENEKSILAKKGIKFVEEEFLGKVNSSIDTSLDDDVLIIAPVHCTIDSKVHMTHHDAIKFLLKDKINVPIIEVTGVKGKTSVVWMLKEIFKNLNPLSLSSLGVEVIENGKSKILKQDISITPASIIKTWDLARNYKNVGICIFETSLGGTGLADVGIITNIVENYPIASGEKNASIAKSQMLKSKIIVCDYDSFNRFYSDFEGNVNTFGINGNANVNALKINFGLDKTAFKVVINDLKTKEGILNTEFEIETFAPAEHHLKNVLCAICAALTMKVPINQIKEGLKNFKGINGRTSIKKVKGSTIIEEINPGINVTAIKKSVKMVENFENSLVIFGGKYGVTCEEIDENAAIEFFNNMSNKIELILVDELGKNIKGKIKRKYKYVNNFSNAVEEAVESPKMILLIFRSNFSDLSKR